VYCLGLEKVGVKADEEVSMAQRAIEVSLAIL
jgi:hypothetical protein